ncbi:MAG: hypothetical protein HN548_00335 [Opitutae bacterium]|jgi:hypothetical protein|nr:hypothetical protein [Opitutae bacterium]MBT5716316.1 hypothetical protein [Opitutae bacterium]
MKKITKRLCLLFLFFLACCGKEIQGNYSALVEGDEVTLQFKDGKKVLLEGYFSPVALTGDWVEEKTFGDPMIWITFNGPKEKPFRLRFELKPDGNNFLLVGIKARPMGKGTKLNPVKFNGSPLFKPNL